MNNTHKFFAAMVRYRFVAACAVIAGIFFFWPDVVHAAPDSALPPDPEVSDLLRGINEIFNMVIRLSAAWLWPVLVMIGSLLDNDLIFGGAMGERLLSVWDQIRDLTNIIFVLVLLVIAVYNVLGLGEEGAGAQFGLKQAMPRFALALLAVNFSFLAAKVVLDFTNVLTGAVFALPTTTLQEDGRQVSLQATVDSIICGTESSDMPMRPAWCDGNKINDRAKAFFSKLDRSNITIAYAIRFGRSAQLKFIRDGLRGVTQLGFNIIFNAVLYFVFAISFLVLFLVLLFRIVSLWVGVVLSPLLALGIVLPNLSQLAGEGGGNIRERFVNDAIAPIKIGLVLAVGYIMLDGFAADSSIHGELLSSHSLEAVDPNALPTDINDLQQLMIAVAVVVIVWMGVFAAAEKASANFITGKIKDTMQSFGTWVSKLPLYMQIIPISGKLKGARAAFGEKAGLAELMGFGRGIAHGVDERFGGRAGSDYARGLLGLENLSNEQRAAWSAASNAGRGDLRPLAQAIAHHAEALRNGDGYRYLLEAIKKQNPEMTPDSIKDTYGDGRDLKKMADGIFANKPLLAAIQGEGGRADLDSEERILRAINGESPLRPGSVQTGPQVVAALKNTQATPADLAKEQIFAASGWTAPQVTELRKLRDQLKGVADALIENRVAAEEFNPAGPTGVLAQTEALKKVVDTLNGLKSATTISVLQQDQIAAAIKAANTAGVQTDILQQAVNSSSGPVKDAAQNALNSNTAGSGAPAHPSAT